MIIDLIFWAFVILALAAGWGECKYGG